MRTLEDYLSGDYTIDKQDIKSLEVNILQVADCLTELFSAGDWPYEVRVSDIANAARRAPSQGTLAMVLAASGRVVGYCALPNDQTSPLKLRKGHKLEENWDDGLTSLETSLVTGISSGSFGKNNPITTSHITELCRSIDAAGAKNSEKIKPLLKEAKNNLERELFKKSLEDDWLSFTDEDYRATAFVPLRAVRAGKDLELDLTKAIAFRKYFETTLHDHLSFSAIPDSRFDPAELLFCLEGLMLCSRQAVDEALLDQVLIVLSNKQNTSAHWRPTKPFMATETGEIRLPVSIEGANSLMRSIEMFDAGRLHDIFTGKALPLLRRFWQWLRARAVSFKHGGQDCIGWHSEHVNDPDLIHIWDTSQVLDFMLCYRSLLERHIARETLVLSGVQIREPENALPWSDVSKKFEATSFLGNHYEVYGRLKADFLDGWLAGKPKNYSMLLYGPPGTGKTTVAEELANALAFRLLTVTVSDFLGRGDALVEARAKAVFEMLQAQSQTVILFDEIDSFLLDRDSKHYRDQDTLFQFLTPGMLTKINDLRARQRSIFIIATNYENRIDPAIKRPGRIDSRYLLLPPDKARRLRMYAEEPNSVAIPADKEAEVADASVFLGFKDIVGVNARAEKSGSEIDAIIAESKSANRSTGLTSYERRAKEEADNFPTEEFACMLLLETEAKGKAVVSTDLGKNLIDRIVSQVEIIKKRGTADGLDMSWAKVS